MKFFKKQGREKERKMANLENKVKDLEDEALLDLESHK